MTPSMLVFGLLAASLPATPPVPAAQCVTYDSHYATAPLMRVSGLKTTKVHLQDQARPCPETSACAWRRAAYRVPGDVVLVSAPVNGFRCAYVGSRGRLSAGFLPTASLIADDERTDITPGWLRGRWSDGSDLITIEQRGGHLIAHGDGIWPGRNFAGPPGPNIGEFQGEPMISGDHVAIYDGTCHVEARRRGPYLIVSDNQNCGGMSVRFQGIYVAG